MGKIFVTPMSSLGGVCLIFGIAHYLHLLHHVFKYKQGKVLPQRTSDDNDLIIAYLNNFCTEMPITTVQKT